MKKNKIVVPDFLQQLSKMTRLKDILHAIGKTSGITLSRSYYTLSPLNGPDDKFLLSERSRSSWFNDEPYLLVDNYTLSQQLLYIAEDLSTWVLTIRFRTNEYLDLYLLPKLKDRVLDIVSVEIRDIKPITKLLYDYETIQSQEEVLELVELAEAALAELWLAALDWLAAWSWLACWS